MTAPYTGHLRRDPATGEITGVLVDCMGCELHLTATKSADGYDLTATVAFPPSLALPWDDADAA